MKAAHLFLRYLECFERFVAVTMFAMMALVVIADVIAREVTGVGIAGAPRIAVYSFIIMSMISFGLASASAAHLRPRFAEKIWPAAWENAIRRLQEILMALFCLTATIVAGKVVYETYQLEEVSRTLRIAIWPMQAVFPLVFFLAFIRHGLFALFLDLKPMPAGLREGEVESQT